MLARQKTHLSLYVNRGADLPGPSRLLEARARKCGT